MRDLTHEHEAEDQQQAAQAPDLGAHRHALAEGPQGDGQAEVEPEEPYFPDLSDATEANQAALAGWGQTNHALLRPDVLEGALGRAQNYWYYEGSLPKAAAALAHGVGQAQAFEDGNKRTAYWLTHHFLHENGLGHIAPSDDEELADHLIGYGEGTHQMEDTASMFENRMQQGGQAQQPNPEAPERLASSPQTSWHLTDNPQFALDPNYRPHNNTTLGGDWPEQGIFVAPDLEPWFNGYDYVRPFAAEIEHPSLKDLGGYGGEGFLPATHFPQSRVKRVIPWDEYVRETYGEPGHFEDYHDLDGVPYHEQPKYPGYRYEGPDVRDMAPEDAQRHIDRTNAYIKGVRPHILGKIANILDPISDTLDPTVWDDPGSPKPRLKPEHTEWITETIFRVLEDAGYDNPDKWLTLVLTGSLTTYQYSENSDCDVSLFVDSDVFPDWSRAEMIGLMISNMDGQLLPGTTHPMQDFVVSSKLKPRDLYKPGLRSGYIVYGRGAGTWIVPPDRSRVHDVEREMNEAYTIALESADKMEKLLRYEPDKAVMYWHQIHKRRQRDQADGKGDFSPSNLVYKMLDNRGLFPKLEEVSGLHIAANNPYEGDLWRGEVRYTKDPLVELQNTGVGMHWTADPGVILHPQPFDMDNQPMVNYVWHAKGDPELEIPAHHPVWNGRSRPASWEQEHRFTPGSQPTIKGAWVWHGEGQPRSMTFYPPTGEVDPNWVYHPINQPGEINHTNSHIDYSRFGW